MSFAASYISANSFSVSGDQTQYFTVGNSVRVSQGDYFVFSHVFSVSLSGSNTIVVLRDATLNSNVELAYPGLLSGTYSALPMHNHTDDWTGGLISGGGGGSPGGSDTSVQFNDSGSFGGSSDLTFDKTNKVLFSDILKTNKILHDSREFLVKRGSSWEENFCLGHQSGYLLGTGVKNLCIGHYSGYSLDTSQESLFIGYQSGNKVKRAYGNTFLGYRSGFETVYTEVSGVAYNGEASYNSAFGAYSLYHNKGGKHNLALGSNALYSATENNYQLAIGTNALYSYNDTSSSGGNLAVGDSSCYGLSSGANNVSIGTNSMYGSGTVDKCTVVGDQALYKAGSSGTSTSSNSVYGYYSGYELTSGKNNCCFGAQSGQRITTGEDNTFVGTGSGYNNYAGSRNTYIGRLAGNWCSGASRCIKIGYGAGQNDNTSDRLYIDVWNTSDPLIYGEFDNNLIKINGRLRVTDNSATAVAGDIRYNSSTNKHQGYDGSVWHDFY